MKQVTLFILSCFIFIMIEMINSHKTAHKSRNHVKNKHKKSMNLAKKNYPFTNFNDDSIRALLYSEKPNTNSKTLDKDDIDISKRSDTFKSVSPFEDSTINSQGRKFSQVYSTNKNKNHFAAGYYGVSRLTR